MAASQRRHRSRRTWDTLKIRPQPITQPSCGIRALGWSRCTSWLMGHLHKSPLCCTKTPSTVRYFVQSQPDCGSRRKPPSNSSSEAARGADLMPPRVPISSRPGFQFEFAQGSRGSEVMISAFSVCGQGLARGPSSRSHRRSLTEGLRAGVAERWRAAHPLGEPEHVMRRDLSSAWVG